MKKTLCSLAFGWGISSALLFGQAPFTRALKVRNYDLTILPVAQTGGYQLSGDAHNTEQAFIELDSSGNVIASQTISNDGNYYYKRMARLVDGGQVVMGFILVNGASGLPFSQFRTANGQLMAPITYDFGSSSEAEDVVGTQDSGFVWVGYRNLSGNGRARYIVKCDHQGMVQWAKQYYGEPGDSFEASCIQELENGDLLAGITVYIAGLSRTELLLARIAPTGEVRWAKRYGAPGYLFETGNLRAVGGKVWMSDVVNDFTSRQIGMVHFDTAGNVLSNAHFGGYSSGIGGVVAVDALQRASLAGSHRDNGSNAQNFLVSFDTAGAIEGSASYSIAGDSYILAAFRRPQGGYRLLLADYYGPTQTTFAVTDQAGHLSPACGDDTFTPTAYTLNITTTPYPLFLVDLVPVTAPRVFALTNYPVTDSLLCPHIVSSDAPLPAAGALVHPQPVRHAAHIRLGQDAMAGGATLHVTDPQGRTVHAQVCQEADGFLFHRDGLPAGLYGYQVLQAGRRIASGKLWIAD